MFLSDCWDCLFWRETEVQSAGYDVNHGFHIRVACERP
jgi:hypothetical protein